MADKTLKELRKLNKVLYGGSMALQGTRLVSNPAGAMGNISPIVGIGIAGTVSDKSFDLMSRNKKRRKKRWLKCQKL